MKQWTISAKNIKEGEPDIKWIIAAEDEDEAADIGFKKAEEDKNASKHSLGIDQYPLDTEGREDKEEITWRLFDALRMTREYMELASLEYTKDGYKEIVTATFEDGHTREINVALDSGSAMLRDILRGLK